MQRRERIRYLFKTVTYYLLTESAVITGKSQTEALMYHFVIFFVVFAHAHVVLLTTQKSRRAEKKFHNARSLQENNARSAANQSARTIVAI